MKGRLLCIALVACLAFAGEVRAQNMWVAGAGSRSCGRWMADRSAHNLDSQTELIWIQGYVTGRNAERAYWKHLGSATIGGDMDPEGLAAWVDTFCRQNPLKELYDAAAGLYVALDHQP